MRIFILTCIYFSLITSVVGQNVGLDFSIEEGSPFVVPEDQEPLKLIGQNDSLYFILYRQGATGRLVRSFNKNLKQVGAWAKILEDNSFAKESSIMASVYRDTIYHFTLHQSKAKQTFYLQKFPYPFHKKLPKKTIAVVERDELSSRFSHKQFIASPNSKLYALLYTVPNRLVSQQKLNVIKYDSLFRQMSIEQYDFPYKNRDFIYSTAKLTNNNDLLVLAKILPNETPMSSEFAKINHYRLFHLVSNQTKSVNEFKLEKRYLQPLGSYTVGDEFVAFSCYSVKTTPAIKGTYYVRLNFKTGKKLIEHREGMSEDFYLQLSDAGKSDFIKRKVQKKVYEDKGYVVFNYSFDSIKSNTIIAEKFYDESAYGMVKHSTKDLAVIKLDSTGKQLWSTKIAKHNSASGSKTKFSHYSGILHNGHQVLFYNGNSENLNLKTGPADRAFKKNTAAIVAAIVYPNGQYKRKLIQEEPQLDGYRLVPGLTKFVQDDSILFYLEPENVGKLHKFLRLKFESQID